MHVCRDGYALPFNTRIDLNSFDYRIYKIAFDRSTLHLNLSYHLFDVETMLWICMATFCLLDPSFSPYSPVYAISFA